ncbi:hypothetical protein MHB50_18795 [Siminovitchia sp. FSL H7-0308]
MDKTAFSHVHFLKMAIHTGGAATKNRKLILEQVAAKTRHLLKRKNSV